MRQVEVERRPLPLREWKKRRAVECDYTTLITEPCILTDAGRVVVAFVDAPPTADLLAACKGIKYGVADRTSGLHSRSRTFGFMPRVALRRDFCHAASMTTEHPVANATLFRWGTVTTGIMARCAPAQHDAQWEFANRVLPCWRIPGSVWTSGIVNWDNPLPYHHDAGNFKGSWNAMAVLASNIGGGRLVMPEYGVAFDFSTGPDKVITFDGQATLHGVTSIRHAKPEAYRYSVVWYAMAGLAKGLTPTEELARIKRVKTEREQRRVRGAS